MKENNDLENQKNAQKPSNSSSTSTSKSNKTKKIIAGVACVVVVAGVITGVVLNKDKIFKNDTNSNNTSISENTPDNTNDNTSAIDYKITPTDDDPIKYDSSKPLVCDADYLEGLEEKIAKDSYGVEYSSTYYLRYPYINIKSDYAKSINIKLKRDFDKAYSSFGTASNNGAAKYTMISYQYATSNNILSVVIQKRDGDTNSNMNLDYMVYNINLTTLGEASLEDVCKECGFTDKNQLKTQVDVALNNEKVYANIPDDTSWDETGLFYMDENNCFNIVVQGSASLTSLVVTPDMIKLEKPSEDGNPIASKSYFEENQNLNYTQNLKDDINGKVALIKLGESALKTTTYDEYYEYNDGLGMSQPYNIKYITSITSKFIGTSIIGDIAEFKCTIHYISDSNMSLIFDVAVLLNSDFSKAELAGEFNAFSQTERFNTLFGNRQLSYFGEQVKKVDNLFDVRSNYQLMFSPQDDKIDNISINTECIDCTGNSASMIALDNITITSEDVSAGTRYINFDFSGTPGSNGNSSTGNGVLAISSDGTTYVFKLKLTFNEPILNPTFNGTEYEVSGSTDDYVTLNNM